MNGEHRARARPSSGRDGRFAWLALLILPAILCVASFLTGCGAGVARAADAFRLRERSVEVLGEDILVRGYAGDWSPQLQ